MLDPLRDGGGPREPRIPRPQQPQPPMSPIVTPEQPIEPTDPAPTPTPRLPQQQDGAPGDGVDVMPFDAIGDIPPPPVPPPPVTTGSGVAGLRGTEAGTLSLPGTPAAVPFRSAAYQPARPRFGPGVPVTGGGSTDVSGLGDPDDVGDLLRRLAMGVR